MNETKLLEWLNGKKDEAQENAIKEIKIKGNRGDNYFDGRADAFYDVINKMWELHRLERREG